MNVKVGRFLIRPIPTFRNRSFNIRSVMTKEVPEGHKLLQEGSASIIFGEKNEVFYNKVQVLNRDLSIAVISHFAELRAKERLQKQMKKENKNISQEDLDSCTVDVDQLKSTSETDGIRIFEALSATGLRSIRYFHEIPGVKSILVNDIDPAAVEAIRRNIEFNGLDTSRVIPNLGDASLVMYQNRNFKDQFDVVDLDPYGSAAPFLDSAVQAVANGGLLCVTCTDMAVLSGNHPEVCYAKYRSMPNKGHYLHEMSLRIVLNAIESTANRYQRHIVPIMSCSIDFYVRIFVRVYKSPANVKKASTKHSYLYQCTGCESFHLQPVGRFNGNTYHPAVGPIVDSNCDQCDRKFKIAGPIWSDPIHNVDTVLDIRKKISIATEKEFATKPRLHGLLTTISEEVQDFPLYYTLPGMSKNLHCTSPPMDTIKAALINGGYKVSQSHKQPDAIKTDAPNNVMWDIMRCWVKKHPINKKRENSNSPGFNILSKEPTFEANFSVPASLRNKEKALRFPPNPEPFWGPKSRAVGKKANKEASNENGNANSSASKEIETEEPAFKRTKVDNEGEP